MWAGLFSSVGLEEMLGRGRSQRGKWRNSEINKEEEEEEDDDNKNVN